MIPPLNCCDAIGSEISKIVIKSDTKIAAALCFLGDNFTAKQIYNQKYFGDAKTNMAIMLFDSTQ